MPDSRTYYYSNRNLKALIIKMSFIALIIVPVAVYFLAFKTSEASADQAVSMKVFIVTLFIAIGTIVITSVVLVKRLRNSELSLNANSIEYRFMGREGSISFDQVQKIKVIRTPANRVCSLSIWTNKGKVKLNGFDQMNDIFIRLRQQVKHQQHTSISDEKQFLDWGNPLISIAIMVIVGSIYLSLRVSGVPRLFFTVLIIIGVAVVLIRNRWGRRE